MQHCLFLSLCESVSCYCIFCFLCVCCKKKRFASESLLCKSMNSETVSLTRTQSLTKCKCKNLVRFVSYMKRHVLYVISDFVCVSAIMSLTIKMLNNAWNICLVPVEYQIYGCLTFAFTGWIEAPANDYAEERKERVPMRSDCIIEKFLLENNIFVSTHSVAFHSTPINASTF